MRDTQRREQLLDLAADVLEREGVEAFGVGALARAAGITPPSLYKHFSGLSDIINALVSRGFAEFAKEVDAAVPAGDSRSVLAAFAATYRRQALAAPQLYRLMTDRPLGRDGITPGVELSAMARILTLLGEDDSRHDVARAAWAWAHGLVSLEIAGRFPADADLDAAWTVLVDTLEDRMVATRRS